MPPAHPVVHSKFVNLTAQSAIVIEAKARADRRYRLIKLSHNFGHQIAIAVGLDHAAGRAVIMMDADLQDPPRSSWR